MGGGLLSTGELLKNANDIQHSHQFIITTNKKIQYYNVPAAFDIEVSSFYENGEKRAIMYCWQFGLYNGVIMGRTWDEFLSFLEVLKIAMGLSPNRRLIVYVHNLPYEFQFIRKRMNWDKIFMLDNRKPVYCIDEGGIEFRCSLKLAGGKSLENVGKDLIKYKCKKMVGFLDYSLIRTSLTPLTKKEIMYCENDIRVLLCYIQEKIEQDGDITRIPLTNTGYVRNYCREACYEKWRPYRQLITNLTISSDEYSQLKRAFAGGFTHANSYYVNKTLENVSSHDEGSAYPAVQVLEKFPMSRSALIHSCSEKEFRYYLVHYCCLFDIEFTFVEPKLYHEHPLSFYKCSVCENPIIDNGRIVISSRVRTTMTEQDFFTFLTFYTFEEYQVYNLRIYEKGYLPKRLVLAILELYGKKTTLKGTDDEVNYMISKNMINACFGMTVTDPVRDEWLYFNDMFGVERANIEEGIETYNKNIRRFLFYPWGIWVTAYARANLFSGIAELGMDYVYSDTDSLKSLNSERHAKYFERYNNQIIEKIERAAKYHKIPISKFMPKTKKGEEKIIGLWEYEGIYEKFKTLGAKRYLTFRHETRTIKEDDGTIIQLTEPKTVLTVAGANKVKAAAYLRSTGKPFEEFKDGLLIPPEYSGRLTLTYIDDETEGDIVDMNGVPYHYHELSSVHMEPSDYHLGMSEEFIRYLKGIVDFGE